MSSASSAVAHATTTTWNVDPIHSSAQFKVKHMMISNVTGEFTSITGALTLDSRDITKSQIEASIESASISTRDEKRDAHLKSPDFFDAENFPALTFKSNQITKTLDGELAVAGLLTIHGVTRNAVLEVEGPSAPVKDPYGNTRIGLSATARINRKDFGLTWNGTLETGGVLLGDEVKITLDIQFIQA
jgi:polyisoprenoid-binding protein YceI